MQNAIVGTAGHVDHGKTCLIKALTGVDTDKLSEEKRRGITIELGFTEMPNNRNINIGVIDVPGHEKFIKNMLAGVGGIDLVLLVIAADEGIMPQTREHFDILKALHINKGIIVLTKMDLVDEIWLDMVKKDVKEFLSGSFLENARVMAVSSFTGQNIQELKELIGEMAEDSGVKRVEPELLRIPVDRIFTVDGFGTIVTGTLMEGTIAVGDEVEIFPNGKFAKVRNLQVHGVMVEKAYAGQRTAVNLTNIKKEELKRGDVLATEGALIISRMLDVKIDMFKDSPRRLLNGSRLHLYYGSAEVICKVVLLDADFLDFSEAGYAQLRLEHEIAVRRNDRFILRFYSPLETIGGGIILDANPSRRKRFNAEDLESLKVKVDGSKEEILELFIKEESKKLLPLSEIAKRMGLTNGEVNEIVKPLLKMGKVVKLGQNIVVHRNYIELANESVTLILKTFHELNSIKPGMMKEEFRKRLAEKLYLNDSRKIELLIGLLHEKEMIADNGKIIALPKFNVSYTPQQKNTKDRIESEYKKAGFKMPGTEELLSKESNPVLAKQMIEALRSEGQLEKLTSDYYIHTESLESAIAILKNFVNQQGSVTLSEYRDLLGTSRKYTIIILEYFDRGKMTRLINDTRFLTGKEV